MADILSFNLTQTATRVGTFKPRQMNDPNLSTKLELMGVDVSAPEYILGVASDSSSLSGRFFQGFLRRQTYHRKTPQRTCVRADLGNSGSVRIRHQKS